MILAIAPGPTESAYVLWAGNRVEEFAKVTNSRMLEILKTRMLQRNPAECCVIEMIASYGMPVGAEVFETCVWIGRFMEAFGAERCGRVTRIAVKNHLCHSSRATDAHIRRELMDRFGGDASIKKGGPLHKVYGDCWSALAVGLTWQDRAEVRA